MTHVTHSNAFQVFSKLCITITLITQTIINYRIQSTHDLPIAVVLLHILRGEAITVCLIWTPDLEMTVTTYALFIGIAFFIGYQIKYYETDNKEILSVRINSKHLSFKGLIEPLRVSVVILTCLVMHGVAYYYLSNLTTSHMWIPPLIGSIIPVILDVISFFPQTTLIIWKKMPVQYCLEFNIIEIIGSLYCLITIYLQLDIDNVVLISFFFVIMLKLFIVVLKLCVFILNNTTNTISSKQKKNSNLCEMLIPRIDSDIQPEKNVAAGLRRMSYWVQTRKSISSDAINGNAIAEPQVCINDRLKKVFENELDAYHVDSHLSDACIVRRCLHQMTDDEPFYIADVSHAAKQYQKWSVCLPRVKPFYAVKSNANSFIIKIIEHMGGGFDCASIGELNAVLEVCPNIDCSKRIIYAHPCKPISHIKYFKDRGVLLTVVDNKHELIKIHSYWPDVKVLIRLKTEDSHLLIAFSTKFGANERVAIQLFESAKTLNLNLIGCTFHVGTGCYNINAFTHSLVLVRRLYDIAKSPKYDLKFTMVDIGGGFPGVDEEGKPTFSQMAEEINQTLDTLFSENEGIQIVAEPGRYFSAACMNLVTSIIGCRSNNKEYIDHLSTSNNHQSSIINLDNIEHVYYINDGIYSSLSNIIYEKTVYRISCLRQVYRELLPDEKKEYTSAVFGPTCDSTDILAASVNLPRLEIGDYLWFHNIGAYSNSTSTNFNGFKTTKYFYIWKD